MQPSLPTISPRLRVVLACTLSIALLSPVARAQRPDESRAQADVLFHEGRRLMTAGQLAAGCAKLEESQRLDPKLGRLLNVAYCHEQLERTATAWSEYNQAAALALQVGKSEREAFARNQASALAPKLSSVRMDLAAAADLSQVSIDGREIPRDQWALPFPVDPGEHTLTFAAVGHKTWSQTVTITSPGPLGVFVEPPETPAPGSPSPAPSPPESGETHGREKRKEDSSTRPIGWAVGTVGSAMLTTGIGFGLRAMSLQKEAGPFCPHRLCTASGDALIDDAKTAAAIATVGIAVGIAGIGAGTWLIMRSPSSPAQAHVVASVAPDRVAISLRGAW